jgi:hypothetical protein
MRAFQIGFKEGLVYAEWLPARDLISFKKPGVSGYYAWLCAAALMRFFQGAILRR